MKPFHYGAHFEDVQFKEFWRRNFDAPVLECSQYVTYKANGDVCSYPVNESNHSYVVLPFGDNGIPKFEGFSADDCSALGIE